MYCELQKILNDNLNDKPTCLCRRRRKCMPAAVLQTPTTATTSALMYNGCAPQAFQATAGVASDTNAADTDGYAVAEL